ncbi:MAG: DUF7670 domain-containing protein [Bacteroidota bacterium]
MITGSSVKAITWSARVLSVGLTALFFVFFFYDPLKTVSLNEIILLVFFPGLFFTGYAWGWKNPGWGSLIIIAGFSGFYFVHYLQAGQFPEGWGFFLFLAPALLWLLSLLFRKSAL